jgi:hypothetical protein
MLFPFHRGYVAGRVGWSDSSRLHQFCQTEVENLGVTVAGDHDVVRLQIAMDDAGPMRFRQATGHLLQVLDQFSQLSPLVVDFLAQGRPFDVFHGDEVHAILFADFVDVGNVWMIECRCGLRLPSKTRHAFFLKSKICGQNF